MSTNLKLLILIFFMALLSVSCDTNDDNDPNQVCDAKFQYLSNNTGNMNTDLKLNMYQKSSGVGASSLLTTIAALSTSGEIIIHSASTIDQATSKLAYMLKSHLVIYDAGNVSVQNNFTIGAYPEYLSGSLRFLAADNISATNVDLSVKDINGNVLASLAGVSVANAGPFDSNIWSTSNQNDKIYYTINTNLVIYDDTSNIITVKPFDVYSNSHKVLYFGLEYVDSNTLYALKGDINNSTTDLVKIDISGATPVVSLLKHFTQADLGFDPYSLVNGNDFVQTDFDPCDNSYYITMSVPPGNDNVLVEVKLNSNTINTTNLNGTFIFGLDHFD